MITINYVLPDVKEKYALYLENSVLNASPNTQDENADATVSIQRKTLNELMTGAVAMQDAISDGSITFEGDKEKFLETMGMLDNLGQYFGFNIVTP